MGFVPFDKVAKLEALFTQDGQSVANIFHYKSDVEWDVAKLNDLCAFWAGAWDVNLKPHVSGSVALVMLRATILDAENSPGIEYTGGMPKLGGNGGNAMPNSVTVVVKWSTALRGRSYKGRTYHIGLVEPQVILNQVDAGTLTALYNGYGTLVNYLPLWGTVQMCVASRVSNGVERSVGVATPIVSHSINSVIDTQRRRLPGRGR